MRRTLIRLALVIALVTVAPEIAHSQPATGTPPFGTFGGGGLETINHANLNVHLSIPIWAKAGRGRPFYYILTYDSLVWYPVTSGSNKVWTPVTDWGWRAITEAHTGYISYTTTQNSCCSPCGQNGTWYYWTTYSNWKYHDSLGTVHPFTVGVSTWNSSIPCGGGAPYSITGNATDGSGYTIEATASPSAVAYSRSGTRINCPLQSGSGSGSTRDSNGNITSASTSSGTTTFTDTLGTTALKAYGAGTPTSPKTYEFPNPSGGWTQFVVRYATKSVKTNFGCGLGYVDYGPTSVNLVSRIDLPDGTFYEFTYETTPGDSLRVTGRIKSVKLPTGGTITYTYPNEGQSLIECSDGSTRLMKRTTSDGLWEYTRTLQSGSDWKMVLKSPESKVTVFRFQGLYETKRQVYDGLEGSTLLATVDTCYNGASIPCQGTSISTPLSRRTIRTTLPVAGGNRISDRDEYFNSAGLPTQTDEYAYEASAPGGKVRGTYITYADLGSSAPYIKDRPSKVEVKDDSGNLKAETTFAYSNSVTTTSGTPQWVSVGSSNRGNLTTLTVKTNISSGTTISRTFTYFDTGNVKSAKDFNNNNTDFLYNSSGCANSLLTQVNMPLSLSRSMTWSCTGGVVTSATDENNQVTNLQYDNLWRPTTALLPPGNGTGGWSLIQYPTSTAPTQINTYLGLTDTTASASCTGCRKEQITLDGLGRVSVQSLLSDPEGATSVTTQYDTSGRVWKMSNPHRSTGDPTYGLSTVTYDGLGRVVTMQHPDNNTASMAYGAAAGGSQSCSTGLGYPTLFTDEAGKKRRTWTDALGRVVEAQEVNPDGTLIHAACYTYDVLDNLTQAAQGTQTRTYTYDALSRVTVSTTPEGGTTNFYYTTSGGALCAGDPNAVCRKTDARSITITYAYDALNRLTQKSYSNGEPTVTYTYDGTSCLDLPTCSNKGRRTGMSDGSGSAFWAYDTLGRVLRERRTVGTITNRDTTYTYNIAGLLTSVTYPSGRKIDYTYSTAARPLTAKDVANGINYAVGTCGPNSDGACYAPHGALASVKLGGTITSAYTFNNRLLYATIKGTVSTTNVLDLAYGYFANGNVSAITNNLNTSRTQTFTYDNQNRLGTAQSQATSGSDCWGQSCGYDANNWNNLVSITVTKCTAPGLSVSVNTSNRITNSGFTYNASGDMTADGIGGLSFTWNAEERLTAAGGVTYTYDGDGWRVKKSNGIIHWRSLSGEILAETDLAGNNLREYIYFAGRRVARRDSNGTVYYFLQDHLGSTRIIANASGGVVRDSDYYPHGTEKLVSGTVDDPHKFAGMYFDSESGLYYTWFRMYSPSLGRWLAPDPIAGDVETPGSLNRYAYVLNNPTNFIDPLGLSCESSHNSQECRNERAGNAPPPASGSPYGLGDVGACELDGAPIPCGTLDRYVASGSVTPTQSGLLAAAGSLLGFWVPGRTIRHCSGPSDDLTCWDETIPGEWTSLIHWNPLVMGANKATNNGTPTTAVIRRDSGKSIPNVPPEWGFCSKYRDGSGAGSVLYNICMNFPNFPSQKWAGCVRGKLLNHYVPNGNPLQLSWYLFVDHPVAFVTCPIN